MHFNDYCWHDAVIKHIRIERGNPGVNDVIEFDIEWPDDERRTTFVFEEVYWAEMKLNFGVVTDESIMDSIELDDDNMDLANLYSKWNGLINDVKLKTYKFDLNSTGGEIIIIAKRFREEST